VIYALSFAILKVINRIARVLNLVQYDREAIINELKKFNRPDLANDIFEIAELLINNKVTQNIRSKIKYILTELYGRPYVNGINIPFDFFDSNIGEILFSAYYKLEFYITLSDMCKITGFSRTWLWSLVKEGKIKGARLFDKVYIFPSSSLDDIKK